LFFFFGGAVCWIRPEKSRLHVTADVALS
jgi:hypothetical protein